MHLYVWLKEEEQSYYQIVSNSVFKGQLIVIEHVKKVIKLLLFWSVWLFDFQNVVFYQFLIIEMLKRSVTMRNLSDMQKVDTFGK